ncbi:MAG: response regulator [Deltaproteobacteria bacterium]
MSRVLLIDDEEPFRKTIAKFLVRAGYEVIEAENGERGLRAANVEAFDAVLTDIIMPDMEGLEFIRRFKELDPTVPIVAMSGGGRVCGAQPLKVAKMLGATRVLYKPFERAELLEAMQAALQESSAA